ncbi:MAG: ATP-binding cassette domain-containing protein [Microthrixaceae bacterium]
MSAAEATAEQAADRERDERRDRAMRSVAASRAVSDRALDRAIWAAGSLAEFGTALDPDPLVAAISRLGELQGFTVTPPTPLDLASSTDELQTIAHRSGLRYRTVRLHDDWRTAGVLPLLAFLRPDTGAEAEPEPAVLVRSRTGYRVQRVDDPRPVELTDELADRLLPRAVEFVTPLPAGRAASRRDLIAQALVDSRSRLLLVLAMALGVTAFGLVTPVLTQAILGQIVPDDDTRLLVVAGVALAIAAAGTFVFLIVQAFAVSGVAQRASRSLQSALWDRLLSLPASFFRRYSSGDLAVRVLSVGGLTSVLGVQVVSSVMAAVFAVLYVVAMMTYDVRLGLTGGVVLVMTAVALLVGARALGRLLQTSMGATRAANGWLVQMLNGISKIRLAHAEERMAARYLEHVRTVLVAESRQTLVSGRLAAWIVFTASAAPALYYVVVARTWTGSTPSVTSTTYIAFFSAASLAFTAVAGLAAAVPALAGLGPTYALLRPILDELPEATSGSLSPGRLTGQIRFDHVTFGYGDHGPTVLRDLSFDVAAGSMVAIVGPSGAGKSTVARLIMGFGRPTSGRILFDGRDLSTLEPVLVRRQIGAVIQNGRISRASVLRNILGPASTDEAAAWAAATTAAVAEDIRAMPMGMHTIVDADSISGGQAQRLLIARALVSRPAIMLLDEATSALDNHSQAAVAATLAGVGCTRIVIAHRLSTIRSADLILVMDAGQVVEAGTYDELLDHGGVFTRLARRQLT